MQNCNSKAVLFQILIMKNSNHLSYQTKASLKKRADSTRQLEVTFWSVEFDEFLGFDSSERNRGWILLSSTDLTPRSVLKGKENREWALLVRCPLKYTIRLQSPNCFCTWTWWKMTLTQTLIFNYHWEYSRNTLW